MDMQFKNFKERLQAHFNEMTKDINHLFEVDVDKDELWSLYLNSFPAGTNNIFRERREYDCSCCRQFIKNIGNAVVIKDNKITTIWDFDTNDSTFQPVIDALAAYIKSKVVSDVYVSKEKKIGTDKNYETLESGKVIEWQHFYLELQDKFVDRTGKTIPTIQGELRAIKEVFRRSLDEITTDSVETVLELIATNDLYRGNEWEYALKKFLECKKEYEKLQEVYHLLQSDKDKDLFAWEQSVKVGVVVGKIKNHSMGELLMSISQGEDLEKAIGKYEFIVGDGYKRSKPVWTEKMKEEAKKAIIEKGYYDSLARRYAEMNDISINNILFANRELGKSIRGMDIFDEMSKGLSVDLKKFSRVEEISAEDFINNVLPIAREIQLLLENRHSINMASIIAPVIKDSKTMFKWDNNFSWAYSGNITDSSMKQNVKNAGGNVDGVLRFSIQWNDRGEYNRNDFDAHCIEPNNSYEIYFANRSRKSPTGGKLDVDIVSPKRDVPAVENITWLDTSCMKEGVYKFYVKNFSHNGGRDGFKAEIEFNGQIYSFDCNRDIRSGENVMVAEVTYNKLTGFSIVKKLPSTTSSRELWSLNTNQFIPVSVVTYSPNYWNQQQGIGNKHLMFMLDGCINDENPNGFFNEFLCQELYECRKFMEALGSQMRVHESPNQLSGVGFCMTKRNDVKVKVKTSNMERTLKIKF